MRLAQQQEQIVRRISELEEEIKAQNDWPAEVTYDALSGQFTGPMNNAGRYDVGNWRHEGTSELKGTRHGKRYSTEGAGDCSDKSG